MKISNFITTSPERNLFGKMSGKYASRIINTDFAAYASTKEEAETLLLKKLQDADRYSLTRHYAHSKSGRTVFVLYYTFGMGWAYDIYSAVHTYPSTCGLAEDCTEEKAKEAFLKHVADYED